MNFVECLIYGAAVELIRTTGTTSFLMGLNRMNIAAARIAAIDVILGVD